MLLPKNQLHELETGENVNYRVKDKSYLDWFKRKLTNHHYWLPIIVLYISFTNKTVDVCINVTTRINAPQNQVIKFNQFNMLSSELEINSTPRTLHWAFFFCDQSFWSDELRTRKDWVRVPVRQWNGRTFSRRTNNKNWVSSWLLWCLWETPFQGKARYINVRLG